MNKKKPSYKAWLLMLSSVGFVIGGLGYYKYNQITVAIEMAESFPEYYEVVEATKVKVSQHTPTVNVLGNAASPFQSELSFELPGKVAFVGFQSGEKVNKGDLLFQLDISEESARLKSAKARERHAQSVFRRYKTLLAKHSVSQEQYDQAYAELIVIRSEIEVLQATINQKTISAPYAGLVGLHDMKVGDYVLANQVMSNFIGNTDKVWAEFSVPQFYPTLEIGSFIKVRNIDASGSAPFQLAEVIAKDTQISDKTRSLKYRAELNHSSAPYTPNMPLEVLVPISEQSHVYEVPETSVNQDLYGSYVMKLVPSEWEEGAYRAKRMPVHVISEVGGNKLIAEGVTEGELIAAAGAFKLFEGLLVRTQKVEPEIAITSVALAGE